MKKLLLGNIALFISLMTPQQVNAQGASNIDPKHIEVLTAMAEQGYIRTRNDDIVLDGYLEELDFFMGYIKDVDTDREMSDGNEDYNYGGAAYHIGTMYFIGKGVRRNYNEAVKWYLKDIGKYGCDDAKLSMGYMYTHGVFVEKDLEKAKELLTTSMFDDDCREAAQKLLRDSPYKEETMRYLNAANQGDVEAQFQIAKCYDKGIGIEENKEESSKWFLKAAENGNAEAQYITSEIYFIKGDYKRAAGWLKKAAAHGNETAISVIENIKAAAKEGYEDVKKIVEELNKMQ